MSTDHLSWISFLRINDNRWKTMKSKCQNNESNNLIWPWKMIMQKSNKNSKVDVNLTNSKILLVSTLMASKPQNVTFERTEKLQLFYCFDQCLWFWCKIIAHIPRTITWGSFTYICNFFLPLILTISFCLLSWSFVAKSVILMLIDGLIKCIV